MTQAITPRLRRVEAGHYETPDGTARIVRIADTGPEQWQTQERVGAWWSWIATCATKREARAHLA